MDSVDVLARAKLNLYLRIEARRADGYHDISTVFHAIDAGDRLVVARADRRRDEPRATLTVEEAPSHGAATGRRVPLAATVPTGADNLVLRADALLRSLHDLPPLDFRLLKVIPPGSGLGGGSADAAAALVAIDAVAGLALGDAALHALAARLGSDTAFCLRGGCAVGRGRGERLTPVASRLDAHVVLAWPGVASSTADAYRTSHPEGPDEASLAAMTGALERGDFAEVARRMSNSFYNDRLPGYREIVRLLSALRSAGAESVSMSGSGSSVFALFDDAAAAGSCVQKVRSHAAWTLLTRLAHCGVAYSSDIVSG